tara:strand:- start:1989 stop:2321 length:333 start_codon:yes stop_codon:yes gene_type:complete
LTEFGVAEKSIVCAFGDVEGHLGDLFLRPALLLRLAVRSQLEVGDVHVEALVPYSTKDEDFVVGRVVCATTWLVHDEILILDWNADPSCRGDGRLVEITHVNVFDAISTS